MDKEMMLDKLSDIGLEATKEVIRLADEAEVDRDELFFNFASNLLNMAINCSFAKFEFK